jgi:WD40 repeat protein
MRLYFTPDSKRVAVGAYQDPGLVFWDIENGKELETWKDAGDLHYSPNGHRVTTNINEYITIRDVDTGKTVQQLHTNYFCCEILAFSPDGRWLALMDTDDKRKIQLWDLGTGMQRRTFESAPLPRQLYFTGAVFTPDSRYLISITGAVNDPPDDQSAGIRLLDAVTGHEARKWQAKSPKSIALRSDGLWLAVLGNDSGITVWKRAD